MEKARNIQSEKDSRANANTLPVMSSTSASIQKIEDNRQEAKNIERLQELADKAVKKNPPPQFPSAKNGIGIVQGVFKINGKIYSDLNEMQSDPAIMKIINQNNISLLEAAQKAKEKTEYELKPIQQSFQSAAAFSGNGSTSASPQPGRHNWGDALFKGSAAAASAAPTTGQVQSASSYTLTFSNAALENHIGKEYFYKQGEPARTLTKKIIEQEIDDEQPHKKQAGKYTIHLGEGKHEKKGYNIIYEVRYDNNHCNVHCFHASPSSGS